jgi:hypothetical protein
MSEVPDRMVIASFAVARLAGHSRRRPTMGRKANESAGCDLPLGWDQLAVVTGQPEPPLCSGRSVRTENVRNVLGKFWTLVSIVPDVCAHYYHCCLRKGGVFPKRPFDCTGASSVLPERGSFFSFVCLFGSHSSQ